MHLPSQSAPSEGRGAPITSPARLPADSDALQTKSAELFNNFVSGAVGGFVGTAVNTPCELPRRCLPVVPQR